VSKVHLEVTMIKIIGELKAERIHDLNQIGGLQEENARLKAEVERVIKAGDALAEAVGDPTVDWPPREAAWNAAKNIWNPAKEGKGQP
jgi:uncharacterized small protein (DUF1192 family)